MPSFRSVWQRIFERSGRMSYIRRNCPTAIGQRIAKSVELAIREDRIVISKDSDFVDWLLIHGKPRKLLHITTGNISNDKLFQLFEANFAVIESAFAESDLVELSQTGLVIHS